MLEIAHKEGYILITRDRDFGNLVFVKANNGGVLYLRILPTTQIAVHNEPERVIKEHSEREIKQSFITIEPGSYRIRKVVAK